MNFTTIDSTTIEPILRTTRALLTLATTSSEDLGTDSTSFKMETGAMVADKPTTYDTGYVNSNQVQSVVNAIMLVIVVIIIIFLISHIFIRMHYKAKTEYAIEELRRAFEANEKAPSPFAAPKMNNSPKSKDLVLTKPPSKQFEIMVTPDQLAPILHHMAKAKPPKADEPNKQVVYVGQAK